MYEPPSTYEVAYIQLEIGQLACKQGGRAMYRVQKYMAHRRGNWYAVKIKANEQY